MISEVLRTRSLGHSVYLILQLPYHLSQVVFEGPEWAHHLIGFECGLFSDSQGNRSSDPLPYQAAILKFTSSSTTYC